MENIRIAVATDESIKISAYQLRYNVFSLEGKDNRYADVNQKIYIDEWDDHPETQLLVALDNSSSVIGTLRYVPRRCGLYLGDESYAYNLVAEQLNLPIENLLHESIIITRGVIAQSYRNQGIFHRMLLCGDQIALSCGCNYIIAAIDVDNEKSINLFKNQGYVYYATTTNASGWTGNYFYKKIISPLQLDIS